MRDAVAGFRKRYPAARNFGSDAPAEVRETREFHHIHRLIERNRNLERDVLAKRTNCNDRACKRMLQITPFDTIPDLQRHVWMAGKWAERAFQLA